AAVRPRHPGGLLGERPAAGPPAPPSVPADRRRGPPGRRGGGRGRRGGARQPPPRRTARCLVRPGGDPCRWLLDAAVRALPARRREWGEAMRAELPAIGAGRARWRFAAGCLRVVAVQPELLRGIGYPLLGVGVLAAAATWTGRIAYPLVHW